METPEWVKEKRRERDDEIDRWLFPERYRKPEPAVMRLLRWLFKL